jgi:hypothetical protein
MQRDERRPYYSLIEKHDYSGYRLEYNIKMAVDGVDWIGLAQDRYRWIALVNLVMNLRVP